MSVELNNIIIYILVAVSVAFIVHLLFKNLRKDDMTVVRMNVAENKTGKYDPGMEELTIRTKFPEYKFVDYDEPHRFDSPKESGKCAVPLNGDNDLDFLMKTMSGEHDTCPKQVKTRKQFFNDFMGFRNITEINSSERDDPVDKIQTFSGG